VLSKTRDVVLFGSWQRLVPPTLVTSGSEAGQPTFGVWNTSAPAPVKPCLGKFVLPKSPDDASTVTLLSFASWNASRRLSNDCGLPKASSDEPKLCEMTSARWFFTT
jgi:hypothetical protein